MQPGTAAFEKRVLRFCSGRGFGVGPWPDWDTSSPGWIGKQFAKLGEVDRRAAERWRDAYLGDLKRRDKRPVKVGIFLRDRLWEGLDPAILERAEKVAAAGGKPADLPKPDGAAPAYGPVFMVYAFSVLLGGPVDAEAARHADVTLRHFQRAWPKLATMAHLADLRRPIVLPPWAHALRDRMEPVPVDGAAFDRWRDVFAAHGWPLRIVGRGEVAYLPIGGLDAFAAAVKHERSGSPGADGHARDAGAAGKGKLPSGLMAGSALPAAGGFSAREQPNIEDRPA